MQCSPSRLAGILATWLLGFGLSGAPVLGQGSDACGSAQAISGTGLFLFDNAAATKDGIDVGCPMARDVWFRWDAAVTGNVTVASCGWTTVDTTIAVYDGVACPNGAPLACGDDACGLQSELVFAAAAGQTYLIRVGTWDFAAAGGDGFIEITLGGSTGGCLSPSVGPNLTAGDLDLSIAWGSIGSTSAYSFATTACNMGDSELVWVGASDQHPVVGHNVYRFENGRFEQLGMGWVKHGFAALQRDLCCSCSPSSSISSLGVGCSDPYSASLNGTQYTLGPRTEINAFSGQVTWPIGSQVPLVPATSVLDRRVQVPTDAMDPALHPSAVYIVEAVYASPDDAQAGNGYDNASYRPYRRSGAVFQGAFDMEPIGATERGLPALHAWTRFSATAQIHEVRLPGEGAFWVASDAIDEGGGTWRYEMAVFNLNSERGVAALAVPSGNSPRDFEMAFPRSHSGDPRSNAPWTRNAVNGLVAWSAPNYVVDPNANAILWGTTYSFSFRSDSPPVDSTGTLVLFQGQGPATLSVPLRAPRQFAAPVTSIVCDAEPNSGGTVGRMLPGAFDGALQTMEFAATALPAGSIGMVLASRQAGFSPLAGGSAGNLCLGGAIGRSVGAFTRVADGAGEFLVTADLTGLPQPNGTVPVQPGETWYFQAWHRDGATSNFTTALRATF